MANFGNDKDFFLSSQRQVKGLTMNQTKHKLKLRSWPSRGRFHPYKGKRHMRFRWMHYEDSKMISIFGTEVA